MPICIPEKQLHNYPLPAYLCTVKKALRLVGVLSLLVLYGTAVLHCNVLAASPRVDGYPSDSSYLTSIAFKQSHKAPTESSVYGFKAPSVVSYKHAFACSAHLAQVADQLTQNGFAQYLLRYQGLLIRSRKEDILFPFHYYW